MKKQLISASVAFILLFSCIRPISTFAHVGGGPPFVKVNGAYAPSNPYYQGETTLNIPQDLSPSTYLPKKLVRFEIDMDQFLPQASVPIKNPDDLTFRWSMYNGKTFNNKVGDYHFGKSLDYSFAKSGSYLLPIEAKVPFDNEFVLIDTLLINIVPKTPYEIPKSFAFVGTEDQKGMRVLFTNQTVFDTSVHKPTYLWEFEGGQIHEGEKLEHDFTTMLNNNVSYVYLRAIDDNNLQTDMGFLIEKTKDKLAFEPFGNMTTIPLTTDTSGKLTKYKPTHKASTVKNTFLNLPPLLSILVIVFGIFIAILLVTFFILEVSRNTRKEKPTKKNL